MIINFIDDETYVGSTTKTIKERMSGHRNSMSKASKRNTKLYRHMRALGFDNFCTIEIEAVEVSSVAELHRKEGYYIQRYNSSLNHLIAGRTEKEWAMANRESILDKHRTYYRINKDEYLRKCKTYRQTKGKEIAVRQHRYYEANKTEINAKRAAAKVTCECGGRYCFNNKSKHEGTEKHKTWMKYNELKM